MKSATSRRPYGSTIRKPKELFVETILVGLDEIAKYLRVSTGWFYTTRKGADKRRLDKFLECGAIFHMQRDGNRETLCAFPGSLRAFFIVMAAKNGGRVRI